jgi:histidinol-phosphate aminotransferase
VCRYNTPVRRIWRPALDKVTPYEAGRPLEALVAELGLAELVRLSANENPLGPSPRVVETLRREAASVHL